MMMELTGRVVMVTGASGNLGAAVARGFQATGAQLVLADRAADRLSGLFPDLAAAPQHMATECAR
jgi:3-oxoacyl-[acyl-carrier protein] reductase